MADTTSEPVNLHRDDHARRIRVTVEGPLVLAELLPIVTELRAADIRDYAVLWDMREASIASHRFSLLAIRDAILSLDRGQPRPGPVAIVVGGESAYALARAVVLLGTVAGYRTQAFRDIDAAGAWLATAPQAA